MQWDKSHKLGMIDKAMCILQSFRPGDASLSLAQLVVRTDMSRSTVHRIAGLLLGHRLLGLKDGRYELGLGLFELSGLVPLGERLRAVALPFMQDIYVATKETIHLGVRDELDVVYVEKIHGHFDMGLPSRVGGRFPLTCTGVGKALLAYSSSEIIDSVMDRPLAKRTKNSITDPSILLRELSDIRSTGISYEAEEALAGSGCVAAPILVGGVPMAALSISVPIGRHRAPQLAVAVRTAALGISRALIAGQRHNRQT